MKLLNKILNKFGYSHEEYEKKIVDTLKYGDIIKLKDFSNTYIIFRVTDTHILARQIDKETKARYCMIKGHFGMEYNIRLDNKYLEIDAHGLKKYIVYDRAINREWEKFMPYIPKGESAIDDIIEGRA